LNLLPLETDLAGDAATTDRRSSSLVIGYGNPLRSDDGVGYRVAQELRARLGNSEMEVIECLELAPEISDRIRHATLVIFVDSAIDGFPGEVRNRRLDGCSVADSSTALSHGRTPDALLALARNLYGASPEAHLFTVSGTLFRYGETFSPEVARVFPLVVGEIENLFRAAGTRIKAG
jgi:hydrogenase maturation protease